MRMGEKQELLNEMKFNQRKLGLVLRSPSCADDGPGLLTETSAANFPN